jgi:branched-chain amino acid aminotransferase
LHTPALSGSLLEGVTRDSLLKLAQHSGMEVAARKMPVDELLRDIEAGRCTEMFACGTGAIVAPITAIGEADGREWAVPDVGVVADKLRDLLLDIQEGKSADQFGWLIGAAKKEVLENYIEGIER